MSRHIAGRGRVTSSAPAASSPTRNVEIVRCDLSTKLTLGQFLKLANLIDSGAEAKDAIASGAVQVNGTVETRRGRSLADGDIVDLSGAFAQVSAE